MVDINLFKDDEGDELEREPDQDMDLSFDDALEDLPDDDHVSNGKSEGDLLNDTLPDDPLADDDFSGGSLLDDDLGSSSLDGALDFEEDIGGFGEGASSLDLGDDILLDDDFSDMDDEPESVDEIADYEYGDVQKKKTPIWIWAVLGLFIIAVCVFLFVIQPRMIGSQVVTVQQPAAATMQQAANQINPGDTPGAAVDQTGDSATVPDSLKNLEGGQAPSDQPGSIISNNTPAVAGVFGSKTVYASAAARIVNELSSTGQFVAILLSGANFAAVQYVSETPNVAKAMEHKVATLIDIKNIKLSPEERHRTAGKIHYFGVVSGTLPQGSVQAGVGRYATFTAFSQDITAIIREHGVKLTDIQKLNEKTAAGSKQADIRIKIQGGKTGIVNVIQDLNRIKSNSHITKLFLTPSEYTDFKASDLKLVLEFRLITS